MFGWVVLCCVEVGCKRKRSLGNPRMSWERCEVIINVGDVKWDVCEVLELWN